MRRNLKLKILAGFMLLVALLVVAGTVSMIEFVKLSQSVNALIEDNYKTIEASKTMLEALEREDSGILLLLLGDSEEGKSIIRSADMQFQNALTVSKNNITETNEDKHIIRIDSLYLVFSKEVEEIIYDRNKTGDIGWYQREVYQSFLDVKHAIDELISLNQTSMYEEATNLKDKSHRAIMPGLVAIIGAVIYSLLLSFFISKYYVSPLSSLAEAIKNYNPREKQLRSNIKSDDEIKRLELEVNNLIYRISKSKEE